MLRDHRQNCNMSMLLGYNNFERHKSSLANLQYIFTSTFCDLMVPRYSR